METNALRTAETKPLKLRWYQPSPGRLIVVLLAVEGILLLSERFQWFAFNNVTGWTVLIAIASVIAVMVLMFLWFVLALCFRWRFQFSIRSLLVLTVAVAIPFSWLTVEMKRAREYEVAAQELCNHDGVFVLVDYLPSSPYIAPPEPIWLRKLLGDDFFSRTHSLCVATDATDARLEDMVTRLTLVTDLRLTNKHVTDKGIEHLKGLSQLQVLSLDNTQVTDKGVSELQQALPKCEIRR